MNSIAILLLITVLPAVIGLLAVWYLQPALRRILVDVCGTEARSDFWTRMLSVAIVVGPIILCLLFANVDTGSPNQVLVLIKSTLAYSLMGILASVLIVAQIISNSIKRQRLCQQAPKKLTTNASAAAT